MRRKITVYLKYIYSSENIESSVFIKKKNDANASSSEPYTYIGYVFNRLLCYPLSKDIVRFRPLVVAHTYMYVCKYVSIYRIRSGRFSNAALFETGAHVVNSQ